MAYRAAMRAITLTLRLLVGTGLLALNLGCHTATKPHTVSVGVIDAETHLPLEGAVVHLSAESGADLGAANSGKDGVATLTAGDKTHPGHMFASVTVPGYSPHTAEVNGSDTGANSATPQKVELFAGPSPKVVLTIPATYAGPVVLTVRTDAAQPAGRSFSATVDDTGAATLTGPMVLDTLTPADVTAVFTNGKPVPVEAKDGVARFQWVKTTGKSFTFFVGTPTEAEEFRNHLDQPVRGGQGGDGGGKRGGGGGRRGGGGRGMGGGGMGGMGGR